MTLVILFLLDIHVYQYKLFVCGFYFVFGGVCVLSRCFLDFSVGVGAFVIGLSQISSFFSLCLNY